MKILERITEGILLWCLLYVPVAASQFNIVLFLIDDLGWKDIGCNGSTYYQTPAIDRLAHEGVRFSQAYSACAVCTPSRAAILTGRYPARILMTNWTRTADGIRKPACARAVLSATCHWRNLPLQKPSGKPATKPYQ